LLANCFDGCHTHRPPRTDLFGHTIEFGPESLWAPACRWLNDRDQAGNGTAPKRDLKHALFFTYSPKDFARVLLQLAYTDSVHRASSRVLN
jgi:hypothetical protein